ncbi:hypothetical protein [Marinimicrobium sp. C2-29]|uniref:hypothetical protein n=1 Tax=Marinimicrobium sp. C2-29 TaxID=3139825 RepID=UPI003139E67F
MKQAIKILSILSASLIALSLSACLEVEDNDGDAEVANALIEQNDLLRQQLEEQSSPSVTLHGEVVDLGTDEPVSGGSVTVMIGGSQWGEPAAISDGGFEIEGLPAASDYVLLLHSEGDEFIERTAFGSTRAATAGTVFQDFGTIGVSEGETLNFFVLHQEDQEPITNLQFSATSHYGEGSNSDAYRHSSSVDEETGEYSITLPSHIYTTMSAQLDLNNDGALEWAPVSAGSLHETRLRLAADEVKSQGSLYLQRPGADWHSLELRVSVLDDDLNPMGESLTLSIQDEINGEVSATYDEQTQQYRLDVELDHGISVMLPAFEWNGNHYRSASIHISDNGDGRFFISSSQNNADSYYHVPTSTEVLDLVIQPRLGTPQSDLTVVTTSPRVSAPDYGFSVFYSSPIELLDDSVALMQQNAITVIQGNESADDLVVPGSTLITADNVDVAVESSLGLNDTLLSLTPAGSLTAGYRYRYEVDTVLDRLGDTQSDPYGDFASFEAVSTAPFDIADVQLDNDNYTHNGTAIKTENSAGETASPTDYNRNVYVMLPLAIANLENFVLTKTLVESDSYTEYFNTSYTIVDEGDFSYQSSKVFAYSTAGNENVTNNSNHQVFNGMNIQDGLWYRLPVSEYMSDDTDTNNNTITFDYAYETKAGEVHTGTITLPVQ